VTPSIPTQATAEAPIEPDGVGMVNVPVTELKVPCNMKQDPDEIDGGRRIARGTHITLGQDSTSQSGRILYVGNGGITLLKTAVELGLTTLTTARKAGT
jgi:hypothetical protein